MSFLKLKAIFKSGVSISKNMVIKNQYQLRQYHNMSFRRYQLQIQKKPSFLYDLKYYQMSGRFQQNEYKNNDDQYSKNFEDLLGQKQNKQQQTFEEQEQDLYEQQIKLKEEQRVEEQKLHEEAKEKYDQQKEQDFEDLLSGKKKEEMNLQELFKDYYAKAKEIDTSAYKNKARTSLNAFSSVLEKRRQAYKEKQDQEQQQQQEQVKEQVKDEMKDEMKEEVKEKEEGEQKMTQEEMKQEFKEEMKGEEVKQEEKKGVQWKGQMKAKASKLNQKMCDKYPRVHGTTSKCYNYMREVWQETFPNEQSKVQQKIEKRKQIAKQQKQYEEQMLNQEEIDEDIPEWKRGAVVPSDIQEEENKSAYSILKDSVKSKINQTETAQQFYQSDEYKKIEDLRNEITEFKHNLQEEIDSTQNPVIQRTREAMDLVLMESNCARAVKEMQNYDKSFDLLELNYEVQEIFKEFFCNYLTGNLEYLEKVCGKAALAIVKTEIKRRQTENWKYKYEEFLDLDFPNFLGGQIPEKSTPQFSFSITVQEINCRVSQKDGAIIEGNDNSIVDSTYRIVINRHDNPDIELTGHYWELVEFNKINELQKIV